MKTTKIRLSLLAALFVALLSLPACKTATKISNEYATSSFKVECMGVDPNGLQTLRSWGSGVNKSNAIDQAKRRAVVAVMFSGITTGAGGCNKRPLVNEVNARERYEDYFNAFFAEGGAFNKYVTLDEKRTSRIKSANSSMETYGVVVRVDRTALKKRLADDNVIKL